MPRDGIFTMPAQYEDIKESELKSGKSLKEAKRIASATWNKTHPGDPIGPHREPPGNYAASSVPAPHTAIAAAPKEVTDLYHKHHSEMLDAGKSHEEAHAHGLRMIRLAGWFRGTGGKWRQLTPDLRRKVNIREAIKQPDGRYVIQDVDAFYPNAVKGPDLPFSESDIDEMIQNTNRSIANGGQKPGLLETHPTPELKAKGIQLDSHGAGVNWRKSPRGRGWARCDLVDVHPGIVGRWRDRKLTGLSVGIAKDGGGLNKRFGHIAVLGGESQALSHLPATEIYSHGSQVCFSADTSTYTRGKLMPHPNFAKDMAAMHQALCAAYASKEQGEPEADEKLKEAHKRYQSMQDTYASELGELGGVRNDEAHGNPDKELGKGEPIGFNEEAEMKPEQAEPLDKVPPQAVAPVGGGNYSADFAADPEAAFSALRNEHESTKRENANLKKSVGELTRTVNGLTGKMVRDEFFSFVDGLERQGTQLPPKEDIESMFSVCTSAKEPKKAIETYKGQLSKLPKRANLTEIGTVFSAGDVAKPIATTEKEIKESIARVQQYVNFSDEDIALGAV